MKIIINYDPPNWNEYINWERKSLYIANDVKQKEKIIVKSAVRNLVYDGEYPICITFRPHFKDNRKDLDNTRTKGLVDGLVSAGVIKNDNLNCIQKIVLEPIFDKKEQIEIEIEPLKKA